MHETTRRPPLQLWLIAAAVLVVLIGGIPLLPRLLTAGNGAIVLRESVLILGSLLMLGIVLRQRTVSPQALGLRRVRLSTIGWGLACTLGILLLSVASILTMRHFGVEQNRAVLGSLGARPIGLLALIALAAAISEEIVFRAIVISHVEAASGSTWLAGAVSLTAFAFAHLGGWGWSQVLFAAVPGIVLVGFFIWKRNLAIVVIAHFLTDLVGLLGAAAAHAQGLQPG